MPGKGGRSSTRDFAFQKSSDQAYPQRSGARGHAPTPEHQLTSPTYPTAHDRYDAESAATTTSASNNSAPNQTSMQEDPLRYPNYPEDPPNPINQFANFGLTPSGPLIWDWNNSIDFPEFTGQYEPQGELVHELQNQPAPPTDFTIPLPVTNSAEAARPPQQVQSAPPAPVQNPLSPPPKPPQRPAVQTGMKRKAAESEPNSAVSQAVSTTELQLPPAKRTNRSRSSSVASLTSPVPTITTSQPQRANMSQTNTTTASVTTEPAQQSKDRDTPEIQRSKGTGPQGRVIDVSQPRRIVESPGGADMLPAGKVFPIQIGSELFRLSGASISSDAPSYFSHFFTEQMHANQGRANEMRTLYIDRDPATFRDISLHLQGYHVQPRDSNHFVRLFADAQFYSLPRLTKQLFNADIFIRIGSRDFRIPRDLFSSPGDSPNYFSLGFAHFFSTPTEVFPGLDRKALLRPPAILPPSVPNRSGETFAQLIKMLQGYDVRIENEGHRAELLRDARYFHLKGLEQRLIPCQVSLNLKRSQNEILIRLEDIRQSGVSFTTDLINTTSSENSTSGQSPALAGTASNQASPAPSTAGLHNVRAGTVSYARPYTDDHSSTNILVLEMSSAESTILHLPSTSTFVDTSHPPTLSLRATFHGTTLARITSLFSVVASKMGLPATQPLGLMYMASGGGVAAQPVSPANSGVSEQRVRVRWEDDAYVELDGQSVELAHTESGRIGVRKTLERPRKRSKRDTSDAPNEDWIWSESDHLSLDVNEVAETKWVVSRAHWRIRVEPIEAEGGKMQVILCPVRIEAMTQEKSRNADRGFLGG